MAKAKEVAKCLLKLAASEEEPEPICHLRLQKLLYYAQGWHLSIFGKELFPERIEAWANGPVVRDLYTVFADWGAHPIEPEKFSGPKDMSKSEVEFIHSLWNAYKGYSALSLRDMTHADAPWKDARGSAGPAERSTAEITKAAMRKYFSKRAK